MLNKKATEIRQKNNKTAHKNLPKLNKSKQN